MKLTYQAYQQVLNSYSDLLTSKYESGKLDIDTYSKYTYKLSQWINRY